jgi:hypothetical protein
VSGWGRLQHQCGHWGAKITRAELEARLASSCEQTCATCGAVGLTGRLTRGGRGHDSLAAYDDHVRQQHERHDAKRNDPDYLSAKEAKVLDGLRQGLDLEDLARRVFRAARPHHADAQLDRLLREMEKRRLVTMRWDADGEPVWFAAPPGPWRLSVAEATLRRQKAARQVAQP